MKFTVFEFGFLQNKKGAHNQNKWCGWKRCLVEIFLQERHIDLFDRRVFALSTYAASTLPPLPVVKPEISMESRQIGDIDIQGG